MSTFWFQLAVLRTHCILPRKEPTAFCCSLGTVSCLIPCWLLRICHHASVVLSARPSTRNHPSSNKLQARLSPLCFVKWLFALLPYYDFLALDSTSSISSTAAWNNVSRLILFMPHYYCQLKSNIVMVLVDEPVPTLGKLLTVVPTRHVDPTRPIIPALDPRTLSPFQQLRLLLLAATLIFISCCPTSKSKAQHWHFNRLISYLIHLVRQAFLSVWLLGKCSDKHNQTNHLLTIIETLPKAAELTLNYWVWVFLGNFIPNLTT